MRPALPLGRPLALALALTGCAPAGLGPVHEALQARGGADTAHAPAHFRALLGDAINKDAYQCLPPVDAVFSAPGKGAGTRTVRGVMPHYNWYLGPMVYRVGPSDDGARWRVIVKVAVVAPAGEGTLELPDCALRGRLDGLTCEGRPYHEAEGLEACPASGRFRAPATRRNLETLVAHWSVAAEALWNRDARHYRLPIEYDFDIRLHDAPGASSAPVHVIMPLSLTCGRTPYFRALRSGWSTPVVAHELGHFLGLLDEYEALSGITSLYPKTPFEGSEGSRMGVSMKMHTRILPLHHYLVVRRALCQPPVSRDPYRRAWTF